MALLISKKKRVLIISDKIGIIFVLRALVYSFTNISLISEIYVVIYRYKKIRGKERFRMLVIRHTYIECGDAS